MSKLIDLTGRRFGRLVVVCRSENRNERTCWKCICDCGNSRIVRRDTLLNGSTKSCGCFLKESASKRQNVYGEMNRRIVRIWQGMIKRCTQEANQAFKNYGNRGISVCEDWESIDNFHEWAIKHGYTNELTLERINVNGNYDPINCKWATRKEQNNNRRNNTLIEHDGLVMTLQKWSEFKKITAKCLCGRIKRWGLEKAMLNGKEILRKNSNKCKYNYKKPLD